MVQHSEAGVLDLWQELQAAVKPVLVTQARPLCVNSIPLSLSMMLLGIITSQSWAGTAMVHLAGMVIFMAPPSLFMTAIREYTETLRISFH